MMLWVSSQWIWAIPPNYSTKQHSYTVGVRFLGCFEGISSLYFADEITNPAYRHETENSSMFKPDSLLSIDAPYQRTYNRDAPVPALVSIVFCFISKSIQYISTIKIYP